jgi:hypothetical protein
MASTSTVEEERRGKFVGSEEAGEYEGKDVA